MASLSAATCRLCTPGSEYTTGECASDCQQNCVCCVVDSTHRDERFCAFTTVDHNTYDYFDCGQADEAEMESPQVRQRRQTERWIRYFFIIGMLLWGTVGIISIINPTAVMFNVVVDEEYRSKLEEGKAMKNSVALLEEKKKEEERGATAITNFLNELLRSDKASDQDKTAVMHVLELASEKMESAKCAAVVVTAPIKVYGAACIYYAVTCLFMWLEEVQLRSFSTSTHLAWYVCSIIGYALAATGHGRTMESSNFTFLMLVVSGIMSAAWVLVRERIMRHNTSSESMSSSVTIKPV